jgi:hypothetical protein
MNEVNGHKIDKQHIATAALFALKHIPHTDEATLHKFLELINTTGSFGWMTEHQLMAAMQLLMRVVPGVSGPSLLAVLEVLNVCEPLYLDDSLTMLPAQNQSLLVDFGELYQTPSPLTLEAVENS